MKLLMRVTNYGIANWKEKMQTVDLLFCGQLWLDLVSDLLDSILLSISIDGSKVATTPATLIESEQGVQLDEAVPVRKCNIRRNQQNVSRASSEMRDQLHHLARKDPASKQDGGLPARPKGRLLQGQDESEVVEQGEVEERCPVNSIDTPWLRPPNSAICEEGAAVGTPSSAHPSQTLSRPLAWVSQICLNASVITVLNLELPALLHLPASDEVVVIGIDRSKLTEEKHLV